MLRKIGLAFFMLIAAALCASCASSPDTPTPTGADMPNPASVYCEQEGGRLVIRQDGAGGEIGFCVFPAGSECEEWAFLRGECQAGTYPPAAEETAIPISTGIPTPADSDVAADGCKIYRNEALGYSFHYPANARIANAENPLDSLSVEGPLVNGDIWPSFTISHPNNREEYLPPPDVDLEQWLIDHNLLPSDPEQNPLGEIRKPNVPIAGTTAIHLRFDRSPQAYAYDRYYFARAGQLYMIVIGHLGDREDWALYNHFLGSFQFGG